MRCGASDEAIGELFAEAVRSKPADHRFHLPGGETPVLASLSQIGG